MFGILFEGTYLLVDYIGAGFFGTVQLVRHVVTGTLYARKLTNGPRPRAGDSANEIANTPNARGTTQLVASAFYPDPDSDDDDNDTESDAGDRRVFGHTAMILEYVNGGTVHHLIRELNGRNQHLVPSPQKFPEFFIWKCIAQMTGTLLSISLDNPLHLTHRDGHAGNWMLQWSDNAELPNIILGDFGMAKDHLDLNDLIRMVANPNGPRDNNYRPTPEDFHKLREWWRLFCEDVRQAAMVVGGMMVIRSGNPEEYSSAIQNAIRVAVMHGQGLNGYPMQLVDAMWKLIRIVTYDTRRATMTDMAWRVDQIDYLRAFAQREMVRTRSVYRPHDSDVDMEALRPPPIDRTPAMWGTAEELMPTWQSLTGFGSLEEYDLTLHRQNTGLRGDIGLRFGQYEIVEFERMRGEEIVVRNVPVRWLAS